MSYMDYLNRQQRIIMKGGDPADLEFLVDDEEEN